MSGSITIVIRNSNEIVAQKNIRLNFLDIIEINNTSKCYYVTSKGERIRYSDIQACVAYLSHADWIHAADSIGQSLSWTQKLVSDAAKKLGYSSAKKMRTEISKQVISEIFSMLIE